MTEGAQTFELTTWERMALVNVLGEICGNLITLRRAGKAMDAMELSEEERVLVHFQTVVKSSGELQHQWLDKVHVFDVELDAAAAQLVVQAAQQYAGWAVSDLALVEALMAKLGVEAT